MVFDEKRTSVPELMAHLFEIIDPYSLNKQGVDVGKKYRTGLYSTDQDIWKKQEPLLTTGKTGTRSLWRCCR